ncbi:MAG: CPBP family glutamic-type intramembrane protease [Candidatus Nanopelagicales bacterium]
MIRKHQLTTFLALAFLLPWAIWGTTIAQDQGWTSWHIPQALAFWLGLTMATFGTAALAERWPGVKDLLARIVRARVGWQWYAAALLLTPALAFLAVELGTALGMTTAVGKEVAAGGVPVLLLVSLWLFLLTEESAWRGFALPRLQARMQPLTAALVLGLLWGLWHIPLFLIADSFQSSIPFAGFLLSILATSVLTSWIFNHTRGSVLLAALFHATTDVAIAYTGVMSAGADLFWLMVTLQCLAAAAVVPALRTMPANTTGLIHPEPSTPGAVRQPSEAHTR